MYTNGDNTLDCVKNTNNPISISINKIGASHQSFLFHKNLTKSFKSINVLMIINFIINMVLSFWKTIGTILGSLFFVLILYSIFGHPSLETRVSIILSILIFNLLILVIFPRFFPQNTLIFELKYGIEKFAKLINKIVLIILLSITYIFAVGPIWFFSRVVGKKFLKLKFEKSSWVDTTKKKHDFEEMF